MRSDSCKSQKYSTGTDKVSILLTFHEHEFNNLKTTLQSIIEFTPGKNVPLEAIASSALEVNSKVCNINF